MPIVIPNPPGSSGGAGSGINLDVNRRLTKQFIDVIPVSLVLTPRARVGKPGGGFAWVAQVARAAQVFTLIEPTGFPVPTLTTDGVERRIEFQLLGEWDSALARNDVFTHQDKDWEIVELFYDNGYERRAMVSARG